MMMQNTFSIGTNYPDALECGVGVYRPSVFWLRHKTDTTIGYCQIVHDRPRCITFNLEGAYAHKVAIHTYLIDGCANQSIQQLYNEGRAFNFVNDPKQAQKIQNLEEENSLLKRQIKEILEKVNELETHTKALQKSMPKEITSDNCFDILKDRGIEMCIITTKTRINILDPPFIIAKSDICMDEDIFDLCIDKFKDKGIVICGETPEYKMFE